MTWGHIERPWGPNDRVACEAGYLIVDQAQPTIGFIGIGLLGRALALAMDQQGYRIKGFHSRRASSAHDAAAQLRDCEVYDEAQALCDAVDLVFITTPDRVIAPMAGQLRWSPGQGAVHCCGAMSVEVLAPAAAQGALVGAFHPCQTFAGADRPDQAVERLKGVTFATSADGWLLDFLRDLASRLGGKPVSIPDEQRPLYHASSVLACGYLTALLKSAVDIWEGMGFSADEAIEALYPLSRATLENAHSLGLPGSATGPVMRGDASTVETHLNALAGSLPHVIPGYLALARASLPMAQTRGLPPEGIDNIMDLLDGFRPGAEPKPNRASPEHRA